MAVKRLEYGLILIGVFVFHLFLAEALSFCLLVFFLVLPLFSLLLTVLTGTGLSAETEMGGEGAVKKGSPFFLRIRVWGDSRLGGVRVRLQVKVRNEFLGTERKETLLLVTGKGGQTVTYPMVSEYCGRISCEIFRIEVYDFLWIFRLRKKNPGRCAAAVTVLPEIKPLDPEIAEDKTEEWESEVYSSVKPGDDPSEIFDIREYREGDRISGIHWKLSGKRDALMVKEGGLPVGRRILLVVDPSDFSEPGKTVGKKTAAGEKKRYGLKDSVAAAAFSVSRFLLDHGVSHKVGWWKPLKRDGSFVVKDVETEADFYHILYGVLMSGICGREKAEGECAEKDAVQLRIAEACLEEKNISRILYVSSGFSERTLRLFSCDTDSSRLYVFQVKNPGTVCEKEPGEESERAQALAGELGVVWKVLNWGKGMRT